MEKLLNLLNEYEEKRIKKINTDGKLRVKLLFKPYTKEALTNQAYQSVQNEIISKYYGFIKWLVDNDKIDFELDSIIHKHKGIDFNTGKGIVVEKLCNRYESLLMLLAIQDEPIRFLCEILK